MIELTEESFDSPAAVALVEAMVAEVNERYSGEVARLTDAEREVGAAAYRSEIRPDSVVRPHGVFLVARLDGEPVGCGALRPLQGHPGTAEIKRMYTSPTARRRGVSRVVLARLEAAAVELGYRRLRLETGIPQPEAMALYASAGWEPIEPYGYYRYAPTSRGFGKVLVP